MGPSGNGCRRNAQASNRLARYFYVIYVYECVCVWAGTHRVEGDDHAVEQRAHGVEAAHVQACRSGKQTLVKFRREKEKSAQHHQCPAPENRDMSESESEQWCAVGSDDPEREPFSKTEPRRREDFYKRFAPSESTLSFSVLLLSSLTACPHTYCL